MYSFFNDVLKGSLLRLIAVVGMVAPLLLPVTSAWAAPSTANIQREVDRLRTLAAERYEAANEVTIRIRKLEKETAALQQREAKAQKDLAQSGLVIGKIAREKFINGGLGEGLALAFSVDPTQYLYDASVLGFVTDNFAQQLRQYEIVKQRAVASKIVVTERTTMLRAEQAKLNREVSQAKAALASAEKLLNSLKKADRERLAREEAARENAILNESKKYAQSYVGDNSRGSTALKFALAQVGDIYVWAAAGPTRWDCSGLTMRSFQKAGVSLPHSSRAQIGYGKSISFSAVKPGDLLFFGKPISHVSIYMGGGKMVQAPRPGKKVEVVPFTRKFGAKPFVGARRL